MTNEQLERLEKLANALPSETCGDLRILLAENAALRQAIVDAAEAVKIIKDVDLVRAIRQYSFV